MQVYNKQLKSITKLFRQVVRDTYTLKIYLLPKTETLNKTSLPRIKIFSKLLLYKEKKI